MSNNLFAEKHYKLQLKNKSGNITPPEDGFSEIYVDENTKRLTLLNSSGRFTVLLTPDDNAASATKLAVARTIGGVPFDGSANIALASNGITKMTGYSKPATSSAITTSDTLNAAIGKLEAAAVAGLKVDAAGLTVNGYRVAFAEEWGETYIVWLIGDEKYLEHWGYADVSSAHYTVTITIGMTMYDTSYNVQLTPGRSAASFTWLTVSNKTTTSFKITSNSHDSSNYATKFYFRIFGRLN